MVDGGNEFSLFLRLYIRIEISVSIGPVIIKFGKQVDLQNLTHLKAIKQLIVTSLLKITQKTKNLKYVLPECI